MSCFNLFRFYFGLYFTRVRFEEILLKTFRRIEIWQSVKQGSAKESSFFGNSFLVRKKKDFLRKFFSTENPDIWIGHMNPDNGTPIFFWILLRLKRTRIFRHNLSSRDLISWREFSPTTGHQGLVWSSNLVEVEPCAKFFTVLICFFDLTMLAFLWFS